MNAWLTQYRAMAWAFGVILLLGLGVGIGWRLSSQVAAAQAQAERERSAHQADLAAISNAAAQQVTRALAKQQEAQQALADLDLKSTEELKNANAENDRMRTRLAAGGRVRVAGSCPGSAGPVPAASARPHGRCSHRRTLSSCWTKRSRRPSRHHRRPGSLEGAAAVREEGLPGTGRPEVAMAPIRIIEENQKSSFEWQISMDRVTAIFLVLFVVLGWLILVVIPSLCGMFSAWNIPWPSPKWLDADVWMNVIALLALAVLGSTLRFVFHRTKATRWFLLVVVAV